ncbi:conserved hypothetical protein [Mesorhizobium plurifarium]|uniref:Uncharacterized protein n=1 Tax=Mesorhizobium plurifarium TaxID=69974 RepID=A0A090E3V4_MESPL|nr:conserved hypothetical protein [Mesorhizobium plurifarium]
MADAFNRNDPEYQTDEKWFALVEEEDRVLVGAVPPATGPGTTPPDLPSGFMDDGDHPTLQPPQQPTMTIEPETVPPAPTRQKLYELSRIYKHPLLKVEFNIEAFVCGQLDPDLPRRAPWVIKLEDPGTRTFLFLFNSAHSVFRSVTMTPIDGLLAELALKMFDFLRDTSPDSANFASILADLRAEYATDTKLDSKAIISAADAALRDIALSIVDLTGTEAPRRLFDTLSADVQDTIRRKVASRGVTNIQSVVNAGEFLAYADASHIKLFVHDHPNLFFDGRFWAQPYAGIDFGNEKVNEEARAKVTERYDAYLADAVWLSTQSPRDLDRCDREELIRATLSVGLLSPDGNR